MSDQHVPHVLRDKAERMERAQRKEALVQASHSSSSGFRVRGRRRKRNTTRQGVQEEEVGRRAEGSGWGGTGDGLKYSEWSWITDSGLLATFQAIRSTISHCLLSTRCCKWLLFKEPPFSSLS